MHNHAWTRFEQRRAGKGPYRRWHMGLREMYAYAIQTSKGKFHGNAEERDGKLYFKGTVATEAEKTKG